MWESTVTVGEGRFWALEVGVRALGAGGLTGFVGGGDGGWLVRLSRWWRTATRWSIEA